jgi:murein DD-endopeptidase MepM/ murein hydrolase activator NlpD
MGFVAESAFRTCVVLVVFKLSGREALSESVENSEGKSFLQGHKIPSETLSSFGSYPNPLNLTDSDRARFHPVISFPTIHTQDGTVVPNIQILDFTSASAHRQLATPQEQHLRWEGGSSPLNQLVRRDYAVGRYDENRVGLYESALFDDLENHIDGYAGRRTLHMGIDLDGPLLTPVHAFCDGTVLYVGFNAALGDYGNVIVVEHILPPQNMKLPTERRRVYALYGHLDDAAIVDKKTGDKIVKGQVLGRMGDIHQNGGWFIPHVHFQLSLHAPETHDMPGAVSMADRTRALIEYPDPRYVLGPLY